MRHHLTSLLTSLMRRKVGSELTLKKARLPNGSLADQCFPSEEESRPRTSKLQKKGARLRPVIPLRNLGRILSSPVERLSGLAAVPEDEVDVVGRLDGAGQLGLAADHRVHVADRDCKREGKKKLEMHVRLRRRTARIPRRGRHFPDILSSHK